MFFDSSLSSSALLNTLRCVHEDRTCVRILLRFVVVSSIAYILHRVFNTLTWGSAKVSTVTSSPSYLSCSSIVSRFCGCVIFSLFFNKFIGAILSISVLDFHIDLAVEKLWDLKFCQKSVIEVAPRNWGWHFLTFLGVGHNGFCRAQK